MKASLEIIDLKIPKKEINKFVSDWNSLPRKLLPNQNKVMNHLVERIKDEVENDERPNAGKTPWKGHVYTGSLKDSVYQKSQVYGQVISTAVGYGVQYGMHLEPQTEVTKNLIKSLSIPPRSESEQDLYQWAYDMVTRRTTGKKIYGAAAVSKARRWAKMLKAKIEREGQEGYPIIIPLAEELFQGGQEGMPYAEQIFEEIQSLMGMTGKEEVPF